MKTIPIPARITDLLIRYKRKLDAFSVYCSAHRAPGPVEDIDFTMATDTVVARRALQATQNRLNDAIRDWDIENAKSRRRNGNVR